MANFKDIILIHSTDDDKPFVEGERGWVTSFHRFLGTLLEQISKDPPNVI